MKTKQMIIGVVTAGVVSLGAWAVPALASGEDVSPASTPSEKDTQLELAPEPGNVERPAPSPGE